MFAEVVPEPGGRFDAVLTYVIPEALRQRAAVGAQALVPLGKRLVPGFIVGLLDSPPEGVEQLKQIVDIPAGGLVLPRSIVALARWIAEHYICTLCQALRLALPSGATARIKRLVRLGEGAAAQRAAEERPEYGGLLDALSTGEEASLQTLTRRFPQIDVMTALDWLRARKAVKVREEITRAVTRARLDPLLEAALPVAEMRAEATRFARRSASQARVLIAAARAKRPVRASALAKRARSTRAAVAALLKRGLLRVRQEPAPQARKRRPFMFTLHEGAALREINQAVDQAEPRVFLLSGPPGSAPEQVWISAVEHAVSRGKQAIVLVPEISLAGPRLAHSADLREPWPGRRFGTGVALLHSGLPEGQRRQQWQRIESGEANVVIGARSAIFAPCPRIGLIVVDGEHDDSYKQEDAPRVNARDVAVERGRIEGCPVVLSSSAPSLESQHSAQQARYRALSLPARPGWQGPAVTVVDTRGSSPGTTCSAKLVLAVKRALDGGGRALLLMPRKGFSTALLCADCGQAAKCPNCDVCLTYHLAGRKLMCHHCGLSQPAPDSCPACGGTRLLLRGVGTQRVEEHIRRACPAARVLRLDADVGGKRQVVGKANVIISTGLVEATREISKVTLVGVISADTWLNRPDFRAAEVTFRFLMQAAARAAQAGRKGHLVIQTYQPDHYAIRAAAAGDCAAFYEVELAARREHAYPPFSAMAGLVVSARAQQRAEQVAKALAETIRAEERITLLGPIPAPLAKLKGRYRSQMLVLADDHEHLLRALRSATAGMPRNLGGVSVQVDVDPLSLV